MFLSQIRHHAVSAKPVSVNLIAVILFIFLCFFVDSSSAFITEDIRFFYTHAISSNFSRICGFSVSSILSNCLPSLVRSLILARHSSHSSPSPGSRLHPQASHLYFHTMLFFLYRIQPQSHAYLSGIKVFLCFR